MIKTLIKKQLRELFAVMFGRSVMGKNKNTKKQAGKGMIALYIFLLVYVVAVFGGMFFSCSLILFEAFSPAGLTWLAFSLMGLMATMLAVIGSVFTTHSTLYEAKDNELLLSMPIKPSHILFARMFVLYLMNLFYEALVLIPCVAAYFFVNGFNALVLVYSVILLAVLPLFALALSSVLGWLVALVASRIKNKSFFSVIISLGFIAIYYYFFMQIQNSINELVANGGIIAKNIKTFVYPVYAMGAAASGDTLSLLIFDIIVLALFALVYSVLSKSFIRIVTTNKGGKKAKYREKAYRAASAEKALFRKEISRFLSSAAYILNCGLGVIFILIAAIFLIIKGGEISSVFNEIPFLNKASSLIVCAILGFMATMNLVSAPSVSLEAKTYWLLRSLPVSSWSVLKSKLFLHISITVPPSMICALTAGLIFQSGVFMTLLMLAFAVIINLLVACIGLCLNLKFPNFTWTNEAVPIKQGASIILTMLAGMGIIFFFAILYLFVGTFIAPWIFLLAAVIILFAASVILILWLKKRGTKIFESL